MLYYGMSNRTRSGMLAALCLALLTSSASAKHKVRMNRVADFVKVISGGYHNGNQALIQIGDEVIVDAKRRGLLTSGIHLVAVHNRRVIHQYNYNMYYTSGASEGLARDIASFPNRTLVVIAVKDEATRQFDKRGQEALLQIGAKTGLYKQTYRASYICVGTKGLSPGEAIEKIGMEPLIHEGPKVGRPYKLSIPSAPKPKISSRPGLHEGLMIDDTEILYYIPPSFDAKTSRYLFLIHGGIDWHRGDALRLIDLYKKVAGQERLVLVAPVFDCETNWKVNPKADIDENGHFRDGRIVKAHSTRFFDDFIHLLAPRRSDLVMIGAFDCFREQLLKRDNFYLYGRGKGATFVSSFLYYHPELVDRAAISDALRLTLPDRQLKHPLGLKTDHIAPRYYRYSLEDLQLKPNQLDSKIGQMLCRSVYVIAPGQGSSADDVAIESKPAATKVASQPDSPLASEPANKEMADKVDINDNTPLGVARRFVEAMRAECSRQSEAGKLSGNHPFRIELHTVPETNVDGGAIKAIELLFPGPTAVKVGK